MYTILKAEQRKRKIEGRDVPCGLATGARQQGGWPTAAGLAGIGRAGLHVQESWATEARLQGGRPTAGGSAGFGRAGRPHEQEPDGRDERAGMETGECGRDRGAASGDGVPPPPPSLFLPAPSLSVNLTAPRLIPSDDGAGVLPCRIAADLVLARSRGLFPALRSYSWAICRQAGMLVVDFPHSPSIASPGGR